MIPVLTSEAMREADRYTIEEFGISGRTLMEVAGREAASVIGRRFGPSTDLLVEIYCGKGNNGGDGFVIARHLYERGARVRVIALGEEGELSEDAAANFRLLRKLSSGGDDERLRVSRHGDEERPDADARADVIVDALLGTGVSDQIRDPILELVRRLNEQPGAKVAIDVPTGLHADMGVELGTAFRSDLTVTMGTLKTGLTLNRGRSIAGDVEIVDIGIPRFVLAQPAAAGASGCAFFPTDESIRRLLPRRPTDANKYSVGFALVVSGAAGMTGAPVMASTAAARAGAGYVSCACDERIRDVISSKMTEITTIGLPADDHGIDGEAALMSLEERLGKVDAALIGCGLGRASATAEFIRRFLQRIDVPVVIDADGINALAGHTDFLRERADGRWILTPHFGEFKRLAGDALDRCAIHADDRIRLTQHFAGEWNCILLLKGMPSVVAAPDGRAWVTATGNTGLASAGTGDVLAGCCVGLLSQGLSPVESAIASLHLGGACADRFARTKDPRSMLATDLIDQLPFVLKERFSDQAGRGTRVRD